MTAGIPSAGCPVCLHALPPDTWNLDYETYCSSCGSPLTAMVFPAFLRPSSGAMPEATVEGTEAACFYHATKKAAAACDHCGRYLCGLCQVELSGQNWCPACIELFRSQGRLPSLRRQRTLYDNLALLLATAPILVWPFTLFTAPATLFVVFRYWRTPLSIVPRTKVRYVLAAIIALIEIAAWAFVLFSISQVMWRQSR